MVGIVIVSHSAKVAEGVAELARGMGGPDVLVATAGGLDLPDQPLGTDAHLVVKAIERVYSDDGVAVFVDLGSAVLSTEIALEQLPPERRARVRLCDAPLVEGVLAAVVQARLDARLEHVLAEARGALAAKMAHLQPAMVGPAPGDAPVVGSAHELRLVVHNRLGLHARPAARFVQTASRFPQTDLRVSNLTAGRGPVSATSINGVATLGVRQGHELLITASGSQPQAALAALQQLANENFGDVEEATDARQRGGVMPRGDVMPTTVVDLPSSVAEPINSSSMLQGRPASPGLAFGPARLFHADSPVIPTHQAVDTRAEWERLMAALEKTRGQIQATHQSVAQRADGQAAAIFEAHLLFLDDEALRQPARHAIFNDRFNAAAAWHHATESVASAYRALEEEYLRTRADDVVAVGRQVLQHLLNGTGAARRLTQPSILIAPDLTPAETAQLDPALVLAICTAFGGPTSHSAILARTFGIPAVVGLGESVLAVAEGTSIIVDGETGHVWPDPDDARIAEYTHQAEAQKTAQAAAHATRHTPATTRDGRRVEVAANIGSLADARLAVESGAEAVGLFRTEFLFLDRQTAPNESEQYAAYRAVAEALGGRTLVLRTLDVGGDKPLPYLDLGIEANPFLGWRAIRMCLAQPEFFKIQLRAIVRAAADFPIRVMFPMIATLAEWRAARALLEEARLEVRRQGYAVPDRIEAGIMVEIPAAALQAAHFANEVDFFSIGTNDLTQYTLAAERGNARVAELGDAFHPSVLKLIEQVAKAAHARGKWVGVCGELAGDPLAVPLLVGLGVDELSLNPPGIPRTKEIVRSLDYSAVSRLAPSALELETAEAVRQMLAARKV